MSSALPVINAIWIGQRLGELHAACLRSFLNVGHRVVLHAYNPTPFDVPDGVEIADASDLLPRSMMFRDSKKNSYAPFSDLLRYEIMAQGLGVYADCDVFALKPIEDEPYILGTYSRYACRPVQGINNGVLKLPANCPALADLRRIRDGHVPPWIPWRERAGLHASKLIGRPVPMSELGYQFAGPRALTYYVKRHGLLQHAKPSHVYHPSVFAKDGTEKRDLLLDPAAALCEIAKPDTVTVHLYNRTIEQVRQRGIPDGSPLAKLMARLHSTGNQELEVVGG